MKALTDSSERAYAFAKASGIIAKAFIAARTAYLLPLAGLSELERLVFPETAQETTERQMAARFERRLMGRSVARISAILDSFQHPPAFLLRLLRVYEYLDVKLIVAALADGLEQAPDLTDLGHYATARLFLFPDWTAMTEGSEFSSLEEPFKTEDLMKIENSLDKRYYELLWQDLEALLPWQRPNCQALIAEEVALKNVLAALRLRSYYQLSDDEITVNLIDPVEGNLNHSAAARQSLNFELDQPDDWKAWPYRKILNPVQPGEFWKVNPRYVQNAAAGYLYRLALRTFRFRPLSLEGFAAFIKLLQYEEDLLTSVAEGLILGVAVKDVYSALGVSA